MTNEMILYGYLAFVALALLAPLCPTFVAWRMTALAVIVFLTCGLLSNPTQIADRGAGGAIILALMVFFFIIVGTLWGIRLIVKRNAEEGPEQYTGPNTSFQRFWDGVYLILFGVFLGLVLIRFFASLFNGSFPTVSFDYPIIILSLISFAVCILVVRKNNLSCVAFGIFVCISSLTTYVSFQPDRIINQAIAYANGNPWCFASPATRRAILQLGSSISFPWKKEVFDPIST